MNFYELDRKIQEELNQQPNQQVAPPQIEPQANIKDTSATIARVSRRLGEKYSKYRPLLVHLNKNQQALALFDELLSDVGSMQASTAKRII